MENSNKHLPEALCDVFAKLTGKNRNEMSSLDQLSESEIKSVSGARGWDGNVYRYALR